MLSKILIATDASEASTRMVECLGHLKTVGAHEALLVHVFDVENVGGLYGSFREFYVPRIEEQRRMLDSQGLSASFELPLGFPEYEINRLVENNGIQLIVSGSRGYSRVKEMFLGSTAFRILNSARVPVLLIRLELIERAGKDECHVICEDLFHHILHPTDFSDTSKRAYQYLEHIVKETRCAVTLLHVHDPMLLQSHIVREIEEKAEEVTTRRLERRREQLLKLGAASVELLVETGHPALKIIERAREGGRSLILMGTQGKGFVKELFLGSVSHNVARRAPLPVLFVPAER